MPLSECGGWSALPVWTRQRSNSTSFPTRLLSRTLTSKLRGSSKTSIAVWGWAVPPLPDLTWVHFFQGKPSLIWDSVISSYRFLINSISLDWAGTGSRQLCSAPTCCFSPQFELQDPGSQDKQSRVNGTASQWLWKTLVWTVPKGTYAYLLAVLFELCSQ